MKPDDELCLCFHVTRRKVENFIRVERPRAAAQLADCFGAGTGCGWCRPYLRRLFEAAKDSAVGADLPPSDDYARGRDEHIREEQGREGRGRPPAGP
ncbi:MAG: (2Fe-2S)-binding protein [Planctomycetota bacterium]